MIAYSVNVILKRTMSILNFQAILRDRNDVSRPAVFLAVLFLFSLDTKHAHELIEHEEKCLLVA